MIATNKEELQNLSAADLIVVDPPWHFRNWANDLGEYAPDLDRGANKHYNTATTADIAELVPNASVNSLIFMWVIRSHIPDALAVAEAWGFRFVTQVFTWVKLNTKNMGIKTGMGYYTRSGCEYVYLFKKGQGIGAPTTDRRPGEVIMQPTTRHSEKPSLFWEKLEYMYPDSNLVRLEMFARTARPGWLSFGEELRKE